MGVGPPGSPAVTRSTDDRLRSVRVLLMMLDNGLVPGAGTRVCVTRFRETLGRGNPSGARTSSKSSSNMSSEGVCFSTPGTTDSFGSWGVGSTLSSLSWASHSASSVSRSSTSPARLDDDPGRLWCGNSPADARGSKSLRTGDEACKHQQRATQMEHYTLAFAQEQQCVAQ